MGGPERRPGSRPTAESGGPDNAKRIKMEETNRKGHVSSLFLLNCYSEARDETQVINKSTGHLAFTGYVSEMDYLRVKVA